ncbi:hypothetical protein CC1G_02489 [Coprinopsis cinerea okayama7|uniref:Uncharacterized protein n=1 Tax=Coprinopsis cinerea (strain Okayama-7 / 130 / ATCC MYA-4618 / FGSC 9003) TaxID=240176 RepID=A8NBM9_COPC7|nr:hypothetical protein CC1G_02489 [Coprinopsis cinerea okayama7\|eukprot:XP_001832227.1 hypothetical protein CC1G_02489 [Coprinopsis cinerea okayama7\
MDDTRLRSPLVMGLFESDYEEPEAQLTSEPDPLEYDYLPEEVINNAHFSMDLDLPDDDPADFDFHRPCTPVKRASPQTDEQKAEKLLGYKATYYPRFSLLSFLKTIFASGNSTLKHASNVFLSDNGHLELLELWWSALKGNSGLKEWIVGKAAVICEQEAAQLSNRASSGPHFALAERLRLSAKDITSVAAASLRSAQLSFRRFW